MGSTQLVVPTTYTRGAAREGELCSGSTADECVANLTLRTTTDSPLVHKIDAYTFSFQVASVTIQHERRQITMLHLSVPVL